MHAGMRRWVADLNALYRRSPALHERDAEAGGFEWVEGGDREGSTLAFLRRGRRDVDVALIACNLTPVPRFGVRLGVPRSGAWIEALNGDAAVYGGSGVGNLGRVAAEDRHSHGRPWSVSLTLPPLACVVFVPAGDA